MVPTQVRPHRERLQKKGGGGETLECSSTMATGRQMSVESIVTTANVFAESMFSPWSREIFIDTVRTSGHQAEMDHKMMHSVLWY